MQDFTPNDGLASPRRFIFQMRTMHAELDGRLWFATPAGLAVFDPKLEPRTVPSVVRVEEFIAHDRTSYDSARSRVSADPERVTIHLSAPNLAMPERQRVQYRLDGVDHDWIESGTPRSATYTQLRPGNYVFHARAWDGDTTFRSASRNNVGVSSGSRMVFQLLAIRIAGALLAVAAIALVAVQWQRRRSLAATARLQVQFDARLAERARIARELRHIAAGLHRSRAAARGVTSHDRTHDDRCGDGQLSRILSLADSTLLDARQSGTSGTCGRRSSSKPGSRDRSSRPVARWRRRMVSRSPSRSPALSAGYRRRSRRQRCTCRARRCATSSGMRVHRAFASKCAMSRNDFR